MTTFYPSELPPASSTQVDMSAFAAPLEQIAPGVTALIIGTRAVNENWAQTLIRILPSMSATDEQRALLMSQALQAEKGGAPLPVPGSEAAPVSPWLIGAGIAALTLLF